jgi:flagellar basal body-associated protein FliL
VKKSVKIAIIAGIAVAVIISALAVVVHIRQSAIEGTEHANETISQKVNEAVNAITKPNKTNSEANESPEQRASEGK